MSWTMRDGTLSRGNYSICPGIRGFSLWYRHEEHYGILKREVGTLDEAKKLADAHQAKEDFLLKSLDAVSVK